MSNQKHLVPLDMTANKVINVATGTALTDAVNLGQVRNAVVPNADYSGATDSWSAIQTALLSFGTLGGWSQGAGGSVFHPGGITAISKPLIVPAGVELIGNGWGSQISLITNSQCDMIQFATHGSSSQASILGVATTAIANAFYAKIRNIALHGDSFSATTPAYFHGINITTDPVGSAATAPGADPAFDPMQTIENVWIKAVTGDAINHENGRSGAFIKRVLADSCNGLGFALGTDTMITGCIAAGCSAGFYMNHTSNVGSSCKSNNHGLGQWVSGHAYTVGSLVVYLNNIYWCIVNVTSATVPSSDATHWTKLTAATAPQADGRGYFWDTNAGEQSWTAVDSQENNAGDYYILGPNNGGIQISGTASNVNFNNGQADYNSANPNNYAVVTLDGAIGTSVNITTKTNSTGHGIICKTLNSPSSNILIAATDGSESSIFNGTAPESSIVNGVFKTSKAASVSGLSLTAKATKTTTYTMTVADTLILADASGGAFTITLPDATTCQGQIFVIKQIDTSTNLASAHGASGQTIDGSAFGWGIGAYGTLVIISDGSNYRVIMDYGVTQNNLLDDGFGNAVFGKSVMIGSGIVHAEQSQILSSAYTLANNTSAQKLFNGSSNGSFTAAASTAYFFEADFSISGLSGSSHTLSFGLGGTATFTSLKYSADVLAPFTAGTFAAWPRALFTSASAQTIVASGTNTTVAVRIRGILRVNGGGTIIPQITQGTASAAGSVATNSSFRLIPVGSNTVASIGAWT